MPGIRVEGNDVVAMHQAVQSAVARARAGEGPTLIDAVTYRISGHYSADPNDYQPQDERAFWLKKDPLLLLKARLAAQGVMTDAQLTEIEKAAEAEITAAISQAQADPDPGLEVLGPDDLYSPVLERVA